MIVRCWLLSSLRVGCCELVVAPCLLFVAFWWSLVTFVVLWLWNVVVCKLLVRLWLLFVVWCAVRVACGRCLSLLVVDWC